MRETIRCLGGPPLLLPLLDRLQPPLTPAATSGSARASASGDGGGEGTIQESGVGRLAMPSSLVALCQPLPPQPAPWAAASAADVLRLLAALLRHSSQNRSHWAAVQGFALAAHLLAKPQNACQLTSEVILSLEDLLGACADSAELTEQLYRCLATNLDLWSAAPRAVQVGALVVMAW
jgi:hypothetical protein